MKTKLHSTMKSIAIFSLVFAFAISAVWAKTNYYGAMGVVYYKHGAKIPILKESPDRILVSVLPAALDRYMEEQGTKEVKVTVKVKEELVKCNNGSHYHLDFTFGPSGAHFDPPLELTLEGKYVETGCHVWLYDESGEALDGTRDDENNKITFKILHFSSYLYDNYDY